MMTEKMLNFVNLLWPSFSFMIIYCSPITSMKLGFIKNICGHFERMKDKVVGEWCICIDLLRETVTLIYLLIIPTRGKLYIVIIGKEV